jgi:hypothetical protein
VRIVPVGQAIHVYHSDELVLLLAPDHSKRCQTLGTDRRKQVIADKQKPPSNKTHRYAVSAVSPVRVLDGLLQSPYE